MASGQGTRFDCASVIQELNVGNPTVTALISEVEKGGNPPISVTLGRHGGTYVAKELEAEKGKPAFAPEDHRRLDRGDVIQGVALRALRNSSG
ncbi:hypothetical protein IB252_06200 [Pseudomonas sp. PDM10]|uniref:hypothetical protein n=1 Tax=Pseudomonas sp. PDM10 TaxID=2769269 RepID=UPI00177D0821|nr:hypothetical protein [Pseudomonas sp. PDM10]MBD9599418.1 hypothetical protein [Pseudomonas sp. PDM10]